MCLRLTIAKPISYLMQRHSPIFVDIKLNIRHHCRCLCLSGLPGLGLTLTFVLSSLNCKTQLLKVIRDMQALEKNFSATLQKCGNLKVFHPLKAGILLQISVPPA